MIMMLQLFNWFSKRTFAVVFGLLFSCKVFGSILYDYLSDTKLYWLAIAVCSLVLFLCTILDWLYFKYYPLEAGIFIGTSGRSKKERNDFLRVKDWLRLHPGSTRGYMELINENSEVQNKRVTFMQALFVPGVLSLLAAGTAGHLCEFCSYAFNKLPINGVLTNDPGDKEILCYVGYGLGFASLFSSIIFQEVLNRKLALTITVFSTFSLIYSIFMITCQKLDPILLG
jgi:hypothetical protein